MVEHEGGDVPIELEPALEPQILPATGLEAPHHGRVEMVSERLDLLQAGMSKQLSFIQMVLLSQAMNECMHAYIYVYMYCTYHIMHSFIDS